MPGIFSKGGFFDKIGRSIDKKTNGFGTKYLNMVKSGIAGAANAFAPGSGQIVNQILPQGHYSGKQSTVTLPNANGESYASMKAFNDEKWKVGKVQSAYNQQQQPNINNGGKVESNSKNMLLLTGSAVAVVYLLTRK